MKGKTKLDIQSRPLRRGHQSHMSGAGLHRDIRNCKKKRREESRRACQER